MGTPVPDPSIEVDDVDAAYHRAVIAGAISIALPADQPSGLRMAVLQDPFGYQWIAAKLISEPGGGL